VVVVADVVVGGAAAGIEAFMIEPAGVSTYQTCWNPCPFAWPACVSALYW
jgi:hypothetical protein